MGCIPAGEAGSHAGPRWMLHPPLSHQGAHPPVCGAGAVPIQAPTALPLRCGYSCLGPLPWVDVFLFMPALNTAVPSITMLSPLAYLS